MNKKRYFQKKVEIEFSKTGIYVKEPCQVYEYTISSKYLEKWPSFGVLKAENGHFHAISGNLYIFPILTICPIWAAKKCSYGRHIKRSEISFVRMRQIDGLEGITNLAMIRT